MYRTTFVVSGTWDFPLDMLRYDGCHPAGGADVEAIRASLVYNHRAEEMRRAKPKRVTLIALHSARHFVARPSGARWASFGWPVVESLITERVT